MIDDARTARCGPSISVSALEILQPSASPIGRPLLPSLFELVDAPLMLGQDDRFPPVYAVRLALHGRALVRCRRRDGVVISVDVIAVPLRERRRIVGAVGFISQVYPPPD